MVFLRIIDSSKTLLSLITVVYAQIFADYTIPVTWPGISEACLNSLNTTVQCSGLLGFLSEERILPRLDPQNLTSLCLASCAESLDEVKQEIDNACSLSTDIITLDDGTYPATYLIDYFIYTYSVSCRLDQTSNEYCDTIFTRWLGETSYTAKQDCSDCNLGVMQIHLNSPFGYDDEYAEEFTSLTASCLATGYDFTSPAPYTASASATVTAVSSSTAATKSTAAFDSSCVRLYTTQTDDTCNSIALAQNVSTYAIYGPNGISDCLDIDEGQTMCLLGTCLQYQIQANDTCDSIIAASGNSVSPNTFLSWNPDINPLCSNIYNMVGNYICLSLPAGLSNLNVTAVNTTTAAMATSWPTWTAATTSQLPAATGTIEGCLTYTNYKDVPAVQDQFYQPVWAFSNNIVNNCSYIARANNITLDEFLQWNPILDVPNANASCSLVPGFSYCVDYPNKVGIPDDTNCDDVDPSIIPNSTIATCSCYSQYPGYQNGYMDCSDLEEKFNVALVELLEWNPWLGSDCDTGLFSAINSTEDGAICVAVDRSVETTSSSSTVSESISSSSITLSQSFTSTDQVSSTILSSSKPTSTHISSTTGLLSSTIIPSTTTSTASLVCTSGTGDGNYLGLCDYCCGYGYCPSGVCTCLSSGYQVPPPSATWPVGYPISGEDASYDGLCNFACNHGYCPSQACTTAVPT